MIDLPDTTKQSRDSSHTLFEMISFKFENMWLTVDRFIEIVQN